MPELIFSISVSLDGYVAGPDPSPEQPLGAGGEQLHEWAYGLEAWREPHGLEGGEVSESSAVLKRTTEDIGASIMGRNMFGGGPGPWHIEDPWNGWWGSNPPFHHPVMVLTHHEREPLECDGGTTFTFVTDGIESALEQARRAAGGRNIAIPGGAEVAQQYLAAGLVDRMILNVAPILLGGGTRLFENVGSDLHGLTLRDTVVAPKATHLIFAR